MASPYGSPQARVSGLRAVAALPQDLVDGDAYARRQVERARERRLHRHADETVTVPLVDVGWQSASLTTEDEDDVIRPAQGRVPQRASRLGGEEIRVTQTGKLGFEIGPARPDAQIHMLPVVQPCTSNLTLPEREAERFDQVERCADGETGATGVAGVPVKLRMDQRDVDRQRLIPASPRHGRRRRRRRATGCPRWRLSQFPPASGAGRTWRSRGAGSRTVHPTRAPGSRDSRR